MKISNICLVLTSVILLCLSSGCAGMRPLSNAELDQPTGISQASFDQYSPENVTESRYASRPAPARRSMSSFSSRSCSSG